MGTVRHRGDLEQRGSTVTHGVALDDEQPAAAIRTHAPDGVHRPSRSRSRTTPTSTWRGPRPRPSSPPTPLGLTGPTSRFGPCFRQPDDPAARQRRLPSPSEAPGRSRPHHRRRGGSVVDTGRRAAAPPADRRSAPRRRRRGPEARLAVARSAALGRGGRPSHHYQEQRFARSLTSTSQRRARRCRRPRACFVVVGTSARCSPPASLLS